MVGGCSNLLGVNRQINPVERGWGHVYTCLACVLSSNQILLTGTVLFQLGPLSATVPSLWSPLRVIESSE